MVTSSNGPFEVQRVQQFPGHTRHGRHAWIARRGPWSFINLHAESGQGHAMDATNVSNRIHQLEFMSYYKETDCDLDSCVHIFAGDLNIHGREDWYLERDGWRDAWHSESVGNNDEEWTWKNEQGYTARFDRIYVHQGRTRGARCVRVERLPFTVEDRLSDHVVLHAVFELQEEDGDCWEVQGGNSSEGDAVQSAASSRAGCCRVS